MSLSTLTTSIDTFNGGANARFVGDNTTIQAGDSITGGAGSKFDAYLGAASGATYSLNSSGVQTFNVQALTASQVLNMQNTSGVTALWNMQSADTLAYTNVAASGTTIGVNNTNKDTSVTFIAAATSATIALNTAGVKSDTAVVTLGSLATTTGTMTSLAINAVAGASNATIATLGSSTNTIAPTTLTVTGAGSVTLAANSAEFNSIVTLDGSGNTGGFSANIASNTQNVTVTGGSGNDTVIFGATYFNISDIVDLGTGTNTLVVGDQLNISSSSALALAMNAAKNISVIGTSASANTNISSSAFTQTTFSSTAVEITSAAAVAAASAVTGGVGATGSAGAAGLTFTFDSGDVLNVAAVTGSGQAIIGQIGQVGQASTTGASGVGGAGGVGGDGIKVEARVDSGTSAATLNFVGTAAIKIQGAAGGAGGAGSGAGASGAGGYAFNAAGVEVLTITTANSAADITFANGAGGTGTPESVLKVGANATINLSGAGDITLARYAIESVTSANNLTVNGSGMTGVLTVVTGTGNDVITGGTKADVIAAGTGVNTVTGNGGSDSFQLVEGQSTTSALTTITDFAAGNGGDKVVIFTSANFVAGTTAAAFTLVTLAASVQTDITAAASLSAAYDLAITALGDSQVAGFTYSGKTYAVFDAAASDSNTIVTLTGVSVANLVQANFTA